MERKQALKYISKKIAAGQSKATIYKDLLPKIRYKSDLLSYISEMPDLEVVNRIKKTNVALLSVLGILLLVYCLDAIIIFQKAEKVHIPWLVLGGWFYLIMPLIMLYLMREVWTYRRLGYRGVQLYAVFMLGQTIRDGGIIAELVYVTSILWIASVFLSVVIFRKAFPYDGIFKKTDHIKLEADLAQS